MSIDNPDNESFSDLFNEEDLEQRQFSPGEKISASVIAVSQDSVFLDVGSKSEGFIERTELEDEEGNLTVNTGDTLDVYFLSSTRGEMQFTAKIGGGSTSQAHLEEAYRSSIPLEGFVKKEIKGGFEVTVAGNIRSFCPFSQMDLKRISDPEDFIGEHLLFKITRYTENGRNIVLSRRVILEEERQEKREKLRETLQEGMTVRGSVSSLREFGAFIDLDGIEGLIPMSEISWGQVSSIHDVLSEGQEVEVVIMKLDWENDRFSFSLKQALPDPWDEVSYKFPVGSEQTGTIIRLTKFGAFVNLAPGIDGLLHISKLGGGRRINHPREVVEEGQPVEVKIENIDTETKRISLNLVSDEADEEETGPGEEKEFRKYIKKKSVSETSQTGTLGDILKAKLKEKEENK